MADIPVDHLKGLLSTAVAQGDAEEVLLPLLYPPADLTLEIVFQVCKLMSKVLVNDDFAALMDWIDDEAEPSIGQAVQAYARKYNRSLFRIMLERSDPGYEATLQVVEASSSKKVTTTTLPNLFRCISHLILFVRGTPAHSSHKHSTFLRMTKPLLCSTPSCMTAPRSSND